MPNDIETPNEELNANSIEKLLDETPEEEEELKEPVEEKEEEKEEIPDEEEAEEEIKLELEDLEEPEIDEDEIVQPVRRKEILKTYPDLFKKFPYLERAWFKVSKYDEMFPTLDDAKVAIVKANTLDRFEQDIFSGNIEPLLQAVKKDSPNGFNKVIDNLFTAIHKADPQALSTLQRNVIARLIHGMEVDGKDNEAIANAAEVVKKLIFGNGQVEIKKTATEEKEDPEKEQFKKEQQQYYQQKFEQTAGDMAVKIQNTLKSYISTNIDPKNSMSPYVRKNAEKDALDILENAMRSDMSFRAVINRCWDNVFRNNYSQESLDKLTNVYKTRAKSLLPAAIKKARNEALKSGKPKSEVNKTSIKSGHVEPREKVTNMNKSRRKSTLEIFMED